MGLFSPSALPRMSLRRQLHLLRSPDMMAELTADEWRAVQIEIDRRLRIHVVVERVFDIVRRAALDVRAAVRDADPTPALVREARAAVGGGS